MNDLDKPLARGGLPRRPDDLDGLLRQFFRAAMPEPWPAAPRVSAPAAAAPPRRWFRISSRFALAAAVGLLVIGYLALAARFPAEPGPAGPTIDPKFSHRPGARPALPAKMPNRVNSSALPRNPGMELLQPEIVPIGNGGEAEIRGARTKGPRGTIYLHVERIR